MSISTIVEIIVGAVVGLLFWRIQAKITAMDADQKRHHAEVLEIRTAERELLLAEAEISALTARCVRGEMVNGELEAAETDLRGKKDAVDKIMTRMATEHVEGVAS